MFNQPVNLSNLRDITGGDAEIEKELFQAFLDSAQDCLSALAASCAPDEVETWRKQSHAFKGISYNLGAEALGDICRTAQDSASSDINEKRVMLAAMQHEFARVQDYLSGIYSSCTS